MLKVKEVRDNYDDISYAEQIESIRLKCRRNKISYQEIANELNVATSTISNYFNLRTIPKYTIVMRLNDALSAILEQRVTNII